MSVEKERVAFQKFWEENFDFEHHEQTYFDEQTQSYENDIGEDTESINMAWMAWQASANREGYKLVPLEPSQEMLIAADSCEIDGKVTAHNIYKAMIGACDDHT